MNRVFSSALLAVALIAGAPAALAQQSGAPEVTVSFSTVSAPNGTPRSIRMQTEMMKVSFQDLDLSQANDGATLLARIDDAARNVCRKATTYVQRARLSMRAECRQEAVTKAVRLVDAQSLTQAWLNSNGQKVQMAAR